MKAFFMQQQRASIIPFRYELCQAHGAKRETRHILAAAWVGVVLGFGLFLFLMADPARVAGFFGVTENWNPGLAFIGLW